MMFTYLYLNTFIYIGKLSQPLPGEINGKWRQKQSTNQLIRKCPPKPKWNIADQLGDRDRNRVLSELGAWAHAFK